MKKCRGCKQEKDEQEFGRRGRNGDGLQTRCKACIQGQAKARYRDNPVSREGVKRRAQQSKQSPAGRARTKARWHARIKPAMDADPKLYQEHLERHRKYKQELGPEGRRDANLRQKYGFSLAEERAMTLAQDGRCAICNIKKKLVVDHCHTTGKVRGLLCHGCNRSIGMLGDDLPGLLRAVRYLQEKGQTFEPLTFIA